MAATVVHFDFRNPSETGTDVAAVGFVGFQPSRRHAVSDFVVLPESFQVALVAGVADVPLEASGPDWCWQVNAPDGMRNVAVPVSATPVNYDDLVDVDPSTFLPSVAPAAAWNQALSDSIAGLSSTYASITPSVGERLRRADASARGTNSIELPALTTLPTITTGTSSLASGLTEYTTVAAPNRFRFVGGYPYQGTGGYAEFKRVWLVSMPSGTGGNVPGDATKSCFGGWAYEFVTDAPKVMIRHLNQTPGAYFNVEVDGQRATAANVAFPATGQTYALIDWSGVAKARHYRIEVDQKGGLAGVSIGATYTIWKPLSPTSIKVCTIGDSVDAGAGTIVRTEAWQKVAGKLMGWTDVRQVSIGGTGFINIETAGFDTFGDPVRVADVVAHDPDLLVIQASLNDETFSSTLQAAALAAFRAYRTALPDVPIVVVGVVASSTGPSAARLLVETKVKAAYDEWADDNSWWIPCSSDPAGSWETGTGTTSATTGTGNRDRFGYDTSHPNTAGHLNLALRFTAAFRSLVLPYIH